MTNPIIIGAGPAGLTAACEFVARGVTPTVLEANQQIGGLAKTVEADGFRFDLGGHRFFTKIPEVQAIWDDLLADRFTLRPRLSRIYYRGKLFSYPLKPMDALAKLGPGTALSCLISYAKARAFPRKPEDDFETWVSNRFGRVLYEAFFRTYTEKVWGMPCTEISADWAAQRIRDLSLWKALTEPLKRLSHKSQSHSLIDEFNYPPHGPQEMWDAQANRVTAAGGSVLTQRRVTRINLAEGRVVSVTVRNADGRDETLETDAVISTMPLNELVLSLSPPAPEPVLVAARALRYRAYLTACILVDAPSSFDDNWIYIHAPDMQMGRLQNFTNWSPAMSPGPDKTAIGLEYFAWQDDPLWTMPEQEMVAMGVAELAATGLMATDPIRRGFVVRSPAAYPVYDPGYAARVDTVRDYLATIPNLHPCGRAGLHRYNNMDHSMITGLMAARTALGESADVWSVNLDAEYHEEGKKS